MDKATSCRKVNAFCRILFAKVRIKTMEGKPDRNLQLDFSFYARLVLPECSYYKLLRSRNCLIAIRTRVQMAYVFSGSQCYSGRVLARLYLMTSYAIFPVHVNFPIRSRYVNSQCKKAIIHRKKQQLVLHYLRKFL